MCMVDVGTCSIIIENTLTCGEGKFIDDMDKAAWCHKKFVNTILYVDLRWHITSLGQSDLLNSLNIGLFNCLIMQIKIHFFRFSSIYARVIRVLMHAR